MNAFVLARRCCSVVAAASRRHFSVFAKPQPMPVANAHRSVAEEMIAKVPVIEVAGNSALCDGGGGATGHPLEFIQLDRRDGTAPSTCKYCGLRYVRKAGHHHEH